MNPAALDWRWRGFDELSVGELDAIYRARQQVFILEQHCVFLDADGVDALSRHLAAWSGDADVPLAYARIVAPGVKYVEPSIGRVLTTGEGRGTGLGRTLVRRAIAHCEASYPGQAIRIGAQARLARFYAEAGFVTTGAPYTEDGIPHIEMLRRA